MKAQSLSRGELRLMLKNLTIGQLLKETSTAFKNHPATIYSQENIHYTYNELYNETGKVAKALLGLGIKKGDHIAVWSTNRLEWILLQLASARIGAVLVTVNTSYQEAEVEYLLNHSDTTALFYIDSFKTTSYSSIIASIVHKLPRLQHLISIDNKNQKMNWNQFLLYSMNISDEALTLAEQNVYPEEVINMQYTSGTTGFPKGVMLSHNNIVNNALLVANAMKLSHQDKLCIPVPFFHCFGCVMGLLASVCVGATMVPIVEFNPTVVLETVEKEKCTALHGVPTMFIAELNLPNFHDYDLSSLRTGIMAGSNCPTEVMKRVMNDIGINEITIAYGQTESSPVITQTTTTDSLERRVTTVGKAHPHVQVKIIDPINGHVLPIGVQGELCAKGYLIMKGYYKMPEETARAIDSDGWLHTGDLAVIDNEGYIKITGRLKDMIIRGGENIYPREIEEFLYLHPKIEDIQVIGVPDKHYGETVVACIKLKPGVEATASEIKEYCKNKLSHFKIPESIYFVEAFPMTASGKIQKYKLREQLQNFS